MANVWASRQGYWNGESHPHMSLSSTMLLLHVACLVRDHTAHTDMPAIHGHTTGPHCTTPSNSCPYCYTQVNPAAPLPRHASTSLFRYVCPFSFLKHWIFRNFFCFRVLALLATSFHSAHTHLCNSVITISARKRKAGHVARPASHSCPEPSTLNPVRTYQY